MQLLRTHLRACVVVWLMCQLASLSAFAQPSCCAAHDVATAGERDCHEDPICPMHAGNPPEGGSHDSASGGSHHSTPASEGEQCPMHAGGDTGAAGDCVMRSTCNGPAVALGALLTVPGVLPERVSIVTTLVVSAMNPVTVVVTGHPIAHDTPPPRV